VREVNDAPVGRASRGSVNGGGTFLFADCVGACVPPRARAQVHSVFPRACNIEADSGELVTLLVAGCGNLPHGVRCASPIEPLDARLRRGQAAILEGATLCIPAANFMLDLSGAAVWNGTLAAALPGMRGMVSQGALREVCETLRQNGPEQGVAPALFWSLSPQSALERALVARMAKTLPILARATETGDTDAAVSALSALIGLGPGLTPAGDDFIVGYLAALWSRSRCEPGIAALLSALAAPLARLSQRTNVISRQMLLDALQGYFAERLIEVMCCAFRGGDVAGATMRALQVGHSSGADVLCGLLFGYSPALTTQPIEASGTGDYFSDRRVARAAATSF
jgi:uncharacterized protein DUF2877